MESIWNGAQGGMLNGHKIIAKRLVMLVMELQQPQPQQPQQVHVKTKKLLVKIGLERDTAPNIRVT